MNRELFKVKGYLPLIIAQIISNLGDWLDILALMALIGLKWEGSPLALSIAMLCLAGPSIFLGSFSGVIADRLNRKMLMISADLLRAAVVLGIAFATSLWQVYLLLILKSAFSTFFGPAESGKIKEMVPDELMQPAVATREVINNTAKIIGPILSGMLVAWVGIQTLFYLDSVSFLLSALFLLGVPGLIRKTTNTEKDTEQSQNAKQRFFKQFIDGLLYIKQSPKLFTGLIVFTLVFFVLQISDSQLIILLREIPEDPVGLLGWLMAASGFGMIIGSVILGKKEIKSFMKAVCLGSICLGIAFALLGSLIYSPYPLIAILYPILGIVAGFSFVLAMITFEVMAQKMTPTEYTGRVFGTIGSVITTGTVLGMLSGGLLSQVFGVVFTFVTSGSLLVLVGVIVYSFHRRLEGENNAESDPGTLREAQN